MVSSAKSSIVTQKSAMQRKRKLTGCKSGESLTPVDPKPVKYHSPAQKFLLSDVDVPVELRTSCIISGYRYWQLTVGDSLRSIFHATNETINVWSHAIAFVLFAIRFATVFSWKDHDPILNPLLAFAFGILVLMATSSTAHLFNCLSVRALHIGFYLDYAAISCYAFSGAMLYFFYSRPLGDDAPLIFKSAMVFHVTAAALSVVCTAINCISRHRWKKAKYVIRTLAVAVNFLYDISPYLYRWLTCRGVHSDCDIPSAHYFKRHLICYLISAIANASKLPERFIPGVFDFFGQSHHFLHILSAMGAADAFSVGQIDLRERRESLARLTPKSWFENSLMWMICVFILNFGLVFFLIHMRLDKGDRVDNIKETEGDRESNN